jgi:solute carrier family 38 (sodium-coupled neutral amino acid transporter), member 11
MSERQEKNSNTIKPHCDDTLDYQLDDRLGDKLEEQSIGLGTSAATSVGQDALVFPSILNLINNILGAGLFSMPWCFRCTSLVSGILLLIFCASMNAASFVIIGKCCDAAGEFSYIKMGRLALGNTFGVALQTVVALYTLGSNISFVVLCGDFLVGDNTGIMELFANNTILYRANKETENRAFIIFCCTILFFFPLSILRNLEKLKYTSALSCLASLYAAVLTCTIYFFAPKDAMLPSEINADPPLRNVIDWFSFPISFWEAVPIVNVAFTAHYNAGRYYKELKDRSIQKLTLVSVGGMGSSLLLYGLVAVTGYLSFGRMSKGNVLENFSPDYSLAIGARIALSIVVIFTLPLVTHSLRSALFALFWEDKYTSDTAPRSIIASIAVGILLACGVIGVVFTKIEVVLAYKGGIFGSCLVYIFPTMMLVALRVRKDRKDYQTSLVPRIKDGDGLHDPPATYKETFTAMFTQRKNWGLAFMFIWGIVSGVLSVTITILTQAGMLGE